MIDTKKRKEIKSDLRAFCEKHGISLHVVEENYLVGVTDQWRYGDAEEEIVLIDMEGMG